MTDQYVLASSSPRRRELMQQIGLSFIVDPADIDESRRRGESPQALVRRLAVSKALTVAKRYPTRTVIGADTIVVQGDAVLGKPGTEQRAAAMLAQLSGNSHDVYTALAVWDGAKERGLVRVAAARVTFRTLTQDEILTYVHTGEPLDKAGAYAIQGRAGEWVTRLVGDKETVIGLPTAALQTLLQHIARSEGR
ncbi:nucleoside triphosphate pyrophosphatase [Sulfobacillus sp. hq2]|uniref:Maf family protein n=1 Tax=Sulfobacillus TaxID=28033 RepID=UPI000CD2DBFA|nr:Maf family protein [Sulfobacillus sp. hq2]POB11811.1 septum formation protein Maf [Sulfobacillus sp. hq2]